MEKKFKFDRKNNELLLLSVELFITVVVKYSAIYPFKSTFLNSIGFKDLVFT